MSNKRLARVKDVPAHYPNAFTEPGIRWLIFNSKDNGFAQCICRLGRKILIDLDEFEIWLTKKGG